MIVPYNKRTPRPFRYVSASQIDAWLTCKRRWFFASILGIRSPSDPSAILGTELHDHNEQYLRSGKLPPKDTESGQLFYAGLPLMPKPGTVQPEIDIEKAQVPDFLLAGLTLKGRIDQTDFDSIPVPTIVDYKTASSARHILTEETLAVDPQMLIYARFLQKLVAHQGKPEPTAIRLEHRVYFTKGQNRVKRTGPVLVDAAAINKEWQRLTGIVEQMKDTAVIPSVDVVPATLSSCMKYNRLCFYADQCTAYKDMNKNVSPFQLISAASIRDASTTTSSYFSGIETAALDSDPPLRYSNGTDSDSVIAVPTPEVKMANPLEALMKLKAANTAALAAATSTVQAPAVAQVSQQPAVTTTHATPNPTTAAALEQLRLKAAAIKNTAAAPANGILSNDAPKMNGAGTVRAQPAVVTPAAVTPEVTVVAAAATTVVTPVVAGGGDEADASTGAAVDQEHKRRPKGYREKLPLLGHTLEMYEAYTNDQMHAIIDGSIRAGTPEAAVLLSATVASAVAVVVETKAETPVQAPAVTTEPAIVVTVPTAAAPTTSALKAQAGQSLYVAVPALKVQAGLSLYIDCYPERGIAGSITRLEDYVQPLCAEIAAGGNSGDGKEPLGHYSMLEFGQGPSRVVWLLIKTPPTGIVVADTRLPITNACLEVLVPMSGTVIRGLR